MNMRNLNLRDDAYLRLMRPYPDVVWINMMFDFETEVGIGSGIIRVVPTSNGDWKAHVVYTNLEDLKGFPEKINSLRDDNTNNSLWATERREAVEFKDKEPTALIIGGSQNGLGIAARLKALGVSALVVEKTPRIGDSWRNRYEALCLHDPVCTLFRLFCLQNVLSDHQGTITCHICRTSERFASRFWAFIKISGSRQHGQSIARLVN
jgi:hypothetical protein